MESTATIRLSDLHIYGIGVDLEDKAHLVQFFERSSLNGTEMAEKLVALAQAKGLLFVLDRIAPSLNDSLNQQHSAHCEKWNTKVSPSVVAIGIKDDRVNLKL